MAHCELSQNFTMNKFIERMSNPETVVLLVILALCVIEYVLNYFSNAPFTFEHLVKYAIAYPIYGMYVHRGRVDNQLSNHESKMQTIAKLEKDVAQMGAEMKLLIRILPKFLTTQQQQVFQEEVQKFHQETYATP